MEPAVEFQENIYYEQAAKPDTYRITFMENAPAKERNLVGSFDLLVNTMNISIVDLSTNKVRYVWPFRYIRRYGRSPIMFQFEAGRKCPSGQGFFSVSTEEGDGEKIFQSIQRTLKEMKIRDASYVNGPSAPSPSTTPPSQFVSSPGKIPKQSSVEMYENRDVMVNPNLRPISKPKPLPKPGSVRKPPTASKPKSRLEVVSQVVQNSVTGDPYELVDASVPQAKPAPPTRATPPASLPISGAALNELLSGMKQQLRTADDESNCYDSMVTMQRSRPNDETQNAYEYGDLDYTRRAAHGHVDDDNEYSEIRSPR